MTAVRCESPLFRWGNGYFNEFGQPRTRRQFFRSGKNTN